MRTTFLFAGAPFVLIFACGGGGGTGFDTDSGSPNDGGGNVDGTGTQPDGNPGFGDSGPIEASPSDASGPEVDYVYAHSPTVLYKVDPVAKTMTINRDSQRRVDP